MDRIPRMMGNSTPSGSRPSTASNSGARGWLLSGEFIVTSRPRADRTRDHATVTLYRTRRPFRVWSSVQNLRPSTRLDAHGDLSPEGYLLVRVWGVHVGIPVRNSQPDFYRGSMARRSRIPGTGVVMIEPRSTTHDVVSVVVGTRNHRNRTTEIEQRDFRGCPRLTGGRRLFRSTRARRDLVEIDV